MDVMVDRLVVAVAALLLMVTCVIENVHYMR